MNKEVHRCSICNRTDLLEIALSPEEYYRGWYKKDKKTGDYICYECNTAIYENLRDLKSNDPEDEEEVNV